MIFELVVEVFLAALVERWPWQTLAAIVTTALFVVLIFFLP
jgi:hypothetical protein